MCTHCVALGLVPDCERTAFDQYISSCQYTHSLRLNYCLHVHIDTAVTVPEWVTVGDTSLFIVLAYITIAQ